MAPEYGATMGFFPVDERTLEYFRGTGRTPEKIEALAAYFKAQGMFGIPKKGQIDYSQVARARPRDHLPVARRPEAPAGPHRPRQGEERRSTKLFSAAGEGQRLRQEGRGPAEGPTRPSTALEIKNGDVLIAAITSCTNTSNPGVLLAAGLLAKKAVELGLTVKPHIKTSLAPGSRVVTEYLDQGGPAALPREARLQRRRLRLHHLHRQRRARSRSRSTRRWSKNDLVCAAVLSGNRNFEAAHPSQHPRQLPRLAAAGGRLRARRHDADGLQDAADRQVEGRQGRLHRPHLAERRRSEAR